MADFPNFGEGGDTPVGRRRYEEMMRQAIARDFNHPSIVAWCLFNETWGFGGPPFVVEIEEPRYGIIKPLKSYNPLWINSHGWVETWEAMRNRRTLRGKMRCLFGAPAMDFEENVRLNSNIKKQI